LPLIQLTGDFQLSCHNLYVIAFLSDSQVQI